MFSLMKPKRISSLLLAGSLALVGAGSAVAEDQEETSADYEVFLYSTTCDNLSTGAMVDDVGGLYVNGNQNDASKNEDDDDDQENAPDPTEAWSRVSIDGAQMPADTAFGMTDAEEIFFKDLRGDTTYSIAVQADNSPESDVIACGVIELPEDKQEAVIQLNEMNGSGFEGRAAIAPAEDDEGDDDEKYMDIEVTTALFAVGSVAPLASPEATPAS